MRVILTVGGLSPEYGGPSRSVPALAEAIGRLDVGVEILTCEPFAGQKPPLLPDGKLVRTVLVASRARRWQWLAPYNEFARALVHTCRPSGHTVVHDNGLWLPTNHAVACAAKRVSCPLVISPRGMLTNWARQFGSVRKQMAWALFQRRDLNRAALIHCTSALEARELQPLGLKPPVAVVPNGVNVPDEATLARLRSPTTGVKMALFLSRIHPKKGLPLLVEAWAQVRPAGWRLVIAGADELGHAHELQRLINEHGLGSQITLPGPVDGEAKWRLYGSASLFIFPSHSENFGIVVAEALASGLPVIATKGTPWQELEEHGCGWWVDTGVEPLVLALRNAIQLDDQQRREMGAIGRKLVSSQYTWAAAARQMLSAYHWICGAGERPSCVAGGADT